jgi:hypothetical protein
MRPALSQEKEEVLQPVPEAGDPKVAAVPRTDQERDELIRTKPPVWEHLLFASVLLRGKNDLEPKWYDHDSRLPRGPRRRLDADAAFDHLSGEVPRVLRFIEPMMRLFGPDVQERIFGAPGEPGEPLRIEHFAQRIITTYEGLLDWAASLRSMDVPEVFKGAYETAARMADQPVSEIRAFIDRVVEEMDRVPQRLAEANDEDKPITIAMNLDLAGDEELVDEFNRQLEDIEQSLGIED